VAASTARPLAGGHVQPGDQLPKVRSVAQILAINPNTVLKA
jgi:GntR family transcriptional regulator